MRGFVHSCHFPRETRTNLSRGARPLRLPDYTPIAESRQTHGVVWGRGRSCLLGTSGAPSVQGREGQTAVMGKAGCPQGSLGVRGCSGFCTQNPEGLTRNRGRE